MYRKRKTKLTLIRKQDGRNKKNKDKGRKGNNVMKNKK